MSSAGGGGSGSGSRSRKSSAMMSKPELAVPVLSHASRKTHYLIKKKGDRARIPSFSNLHPGRKAIISLPKPYSKFKGDLRKERAMRDTNIDSERYQYRRFDKDIRVAGTPDGFLGIHVLELGHISLRVTSFDPGAPMFFYCLVYVGEKRRMTKVVYTDTPKHVRVDSTMYFNLEISDFRDNRRNKVRFEIWGFQEPETHYIFACKEIHLYTFILGVHAIEKLHMWADGLHAATLAFEYAYSYGRYGYGHSNQLKNTASSIFEAVSHSMFPRLRLSDDDLIDNRFNIRIPKKLQTMTLNSFVLETDQGTAIPNKPSPSWDFDDDNWFPRPFRMHQVEFSHGFPVYCKVNMQIHQKQIQADFNEAYGEILCITGRKDRCDYLSTLVHGRLEDIRETEVGPLFSDIEAKDLHKIVQELEEDPSTLIYPKNVRCTVYPAAIVTRDDEEFFDTFPSTTRTSGWLGRLFGYADLSTDPHYGEEDYPLYHLRGYSKHHYTFWRRCIHGVKYGWNGFVSVLVAIFHFILPEIGVDRGIPEISVTLASPQVSTTNFFIQWINEETDHTTYGNLRHFKETNLSEFEQAIPDEFVVLENGPNIQFAAESDDIPLAARFAHTPQLEKAQMNKSRQVMKITKL